MKVLHVIDSLGVGGGAEHSLAAILPLLRERQIENTIATIRHRDFGLQVSLAADGFPIEVLSPETAIGRVRSLRRLVRKQRVDIVHATLFNSCLIARVACIGLPVIVINSLVSTSYDEARSHGEGAASWKLRVVRIADALTARLLVDRVHAVTNAVRREAIEVLRIRAEAITVVPRGRSRSALGFSSLERRTGVREQLGLGPDTPVFLNVGRQDHPKAQADLIRAFEGVLREISDAVLLIAGREGNATTEIQRALDASVDPARIRLLGHREDAADLIVAADIFVFPSLYEGMAGSVLEAMALDTPVIASDAESVAEVVGEGRFGEIVRRGDIDGLSRAMIDLMADADRRMRLASDAREYFEEHYLIERIADEMVEMYENCASTLGRRVQETGGRRR